MDANEQRLLFTIKRLKIKAQKNGIGSIRISRKKKIVFIEKGLSDKRRRGRMGFLKVA